VFAGYLSICGGGGGGGGSATEDAVVAALDLSLKNSGTDLEGLSIGDTEYRCMAKGILSNSAYKAAIEDGITANKTGDDLLGTIDTIPDSTGNADSEMMVLLANCLGEDKLIDFLVAAFAADPSVTEEMKTCLHDGLKDIGGEDLVKAFAAAVEQDATSEAFAALTEVFTSCMGS